MHQYYLQSLISRVITVLLHLDLVMFCGLQCYCCLVLHVTDLYDIHCVKDYELEYLNYS